MMRRALVAAGLVALAGPALARPLHHRAGHHRGGSAQGLPITTGPSDVRINAVGEVIAPKIGELKVDGKQ